MLRQRLLGSIFVRNGIAVQSFGYKKWLPLGDVGCLVKNLDDWGADGIVVLSIDRKSKGPDYQLLKRLSELKLSTPLSYGGGITTVEHAKSAVQLGAERLVLDSALSTSKDQIKQMAAAVGQQALIGCVPLLRTECGINSHWKHWNKSSQPITEWLQDNVWTDYISEILTVDVMSDGSLQGPNPILWEELISLDLPILASGGFSNSEQILEVLTTPKVAAAVIGNSLNYKENSIKILKEKLQLLPLRPHFSTYDPHSDKK